MKKLSLFAALLLLASSAGATEWANFGPRALAMGGTGVALGQGPLASYWNPAGLGQVENTSGLSIPVGVHAAVTGTVVEGANDLNKIQHDCSTLGPNNGLCTQTNLNNAFAELANPNNGARADASGGANLKLGKLVFFLDNFTYIGAKPFVDTTNTTPTTIQNNQSALTLHGISATELGVGYGHELPFLPGMLVGGNLKLIDGRVGYFNSSVINGNSGNSGNLGDFSKNDKKSAQLGVDLGALWDMDKTLTFLPFRPRIGITAHDVNNPKFDQPDAAVAAGYTNKYSLHGNSRMGVAISPLHFWNITADADLTRNLTALEGVASRMVGIGTEVNVLNRTWLNLPLRVGLQRNTALAGSKTQITGGFGLNILHFVLDAGVAVSPSKETIQTQGQEKKFPNEASGAIQLSLLFGGGKEDAPPAKTSSSGGSAPMDTAGIRSRADSAQQSLDSESQKH